MSHSADPHASNRPAALAMLANERPRNLGWFGAAGLLFGDWGTSRLYVLGIAFAVAGRTSFWLILSMNLLILAVAWAYTQICRLYPNGGGVYTAARDRHALLGVLAALLLFADYTVTASLSALDGFHYFGLEQAAVTQTDKPVDAGSAIIHDTPEGTDTDNAPTTSLSSNEPVSEDAAHVDTKPVEHELPPARPFYNPKGACFWAIIGIIAIGGLNLLGPKHSSGVAVAVAGAMVFVTLFVSAFAIFHIPWLHLFDPMPDAPGNYIGPLSGHGVGDLWQSFVGIVLALSGVEAIASLTGVMKKPVFGTSSKSIWVVAAEVVFFNMLLTLAMLAISPLARYTHKDDMLAYMAGYYVGPFGEWPVRILAGMLLLSAANTAIGALMGLLYVMSRDDEMPRFFQKLNIFGAPWVSAIVATAIPVIVLMAVSDVTGLSHLYAIGIVGAVAINCLICAFHPRLRKVARKAPMFALGILLLGIWGTLAITKVPALCFVVIVLCIGFALRYINKVASRRRPKPSLLRQAIMAQLTPEALAKPRIMVATAGGAGLAQQAVNEAKALEAALVVAFVREVALNYKIEGAATMTLDTDPAAQQLFITFLDEGHKQGVPIIPAYDTGLNAPEMLAELAAMNGVQRLAIGTSRRGALHQIIKGSFQRQLESLLPDDVIVEVMAPQA